MYHDTALENVRLVLQTVLSTLNPASTAQSLAQIAENLSEIALIASKSYAVNTTAEVTGEAFQRQIAPILQRLVTIEHDLNIDSSGVVTAEPIP